MNKNEKRIPLTHGTAVVDKEVSPETVNALNKMVECAYKQQSESLRLSGVSASIEYSWVAGADKNFCAVVEEGSEEQLELQAKMDECKRLYGGRAQFWKRYLLLTDYGYAQ